MKASLDQEDVRAIADELEKRIMPMIRERSEDKSGEVIFTPETLASYLSVETSWVYRQVSDKTVPYFKSGKYVRFRKESIDQWINTQERQPVKKFKQMKNSRVAS